MRRDFYTEHGKPKRLFAKELYRGARRSLAAGILKPSLAPVEAKVPPRPTQNSEEIRSIIGHFKNLPDYRARIGIYPLWSLLAIVLMAGIDPEKLEQILLQIQRQIRGKPDPAELINIDGKEPKHGNGDTVLTAVTSQSQFYPGSALVPAEKTNEIPVARGLFEKLDLDGRMVSLDALHTQDKTARALVLEHGADYLLTVKDNQSTIDHTLENLIDEPPELFSL